MPVIKEVLEKKQNPNAYTREMKFFDYLKEFMVQCVNGCTIKMLSLNYEIPQQNMMSMAQYILAKYLNTCWHSYGKKTDQYVIKTIDDAQKFQVVKGSICMLTRIYVLATKLFMDLHLEILIPKLKPLSRDIQKAILTCLLLSLYENIVIEYENINCEGNKCDDSYNHKDLFVFSEEESVFSNMVHKN